MFKTQPYYPLFFFCFWFCGTVLSVAQEPTTTYEITRFKLPIETNATDILEDAYGFVWIATTNGLWRYDGGNFKNYIKNENEATSITDNHISCLYEDTEGTLWVGTYGGGLLKYDREYDRFQRFVHNATDPESLSFNEVRVIFETSGKEFYVGTDGGGLNRMDRRKGTFKNYAHEVSDSLSISHNNVLAIEEGPAEVLYVGTWIGLNIFDPKTGKFKRLSQETEGAAHYYPNLEFFEELIISNTKLYTFDNSNDFHSLNFLFERANYIKKDYGGHCWLLEKDQIALVDSDFELKEHISLNDRFVDNGFNLVKVFHNKLSNESWVLDQNGNFFLVKKSPVIFDYFLEPRTEAKIFKTEENYWVFQGGEIKIFDKKNHKLLRILKGFINRTHISSFNGQNVWVVDRNDIYKFTPSW